MIKVNELRLGNLLEYNNQIIHVTSLSLDIDDEYQPTIGICQYGEYRNEQMILEEAAIGLKGIPLTHEWLERCGFEYLPFDNGISNYDFYKKSKAFELILVHEGVINEYEQGVFYYKDENRPVKHLHQLQNLYFAQTGEELKIEL
jgi:hypothetical protein